VPNQASERLKRLIPKVIKTWEARAIQEVSAALAHNSLALQNSLPEFLNQIADALSTTIERTKIRIKWDREESARLGKKHGGVRAADVNYSMDQVIFEYHIFRQVICEVMEEEAPLNALEREVIVCAVEQAVNDAATPFSETHRDIQEKVTRTLIHDLRAPLASSKLSAQLILKKPEDADQCLKIAVRIITAMDRSDLLIHDLLDASRLRAGQGLELTFESFDIDILLNHVAEEANFLQGNRIQFISTGSTLGIWNEKGLRRVFDNLITNALKFSFPNSPITLRLVKHEKSVEISIHNQGRPIAPDDQAILFQQFKRARTTGNTPGWGLGLTVVKGITEAHGGKVQVESSAESGTTFMITLPLDSYEPEMDSA
jgi:signal transduction histidine kinase